MSKKGKAASRDQITGGMLKNLGMKELQVLTEVFNKIMIVNKVGSGNFITIFIKMTKHNLIITQVHTV